MNDLEAQLKLQAYADGELPAAEAREVESLLQRDPSARATLDSLRNTTAALQSYEAGLRLPESREFFWSKVQREILRHQAAAAPAQQTTAGWGRILRRFLAPAGALAAMGIVIFFSTHETGLMDPEAAPMMEAALAGPNTLTYRDFSTRTTLVWLSYPAEKTVVQ